MSSDDVEDVGGQLAYHACDALALGGQGLFRDRPGWGCEGRLNFAMFAPLLVGRRGLHLATAR